MGTEHPQVLRVLLFGSFARKDYGTRSDLDLLVILRESSQAFADRIADLLRYAPGYPTDIFPLTEAEIRSRIEAGDPFLEQALREGILLWG